MKQHVAKALALVLVAASIGGCAYIEKIIPTGRSGPEQVNDLVGWVDRVYVEAEMSKEASRAAVDQLQSLVKTGHGDSVKAYEDFEATIEASEKQAETLRDTYEEMSDAAEDLFKQWSKDLEQFTSLSMRQRSQTRLLQTRARYDTIVAAVEPALQAYDNYNKSLHDHLLFLGNDLNPDALSVIQGDASALAQQVDSLDEMMDACLDASQSYTVSTALPVSDDREAVQDEREEEPRARVRRVSSRKSDDDEK